MASVGARETLLRALEELDAAAGGLERVDRADVVVVFSLGFDEGGGVFSESGGWVSSAGPSWAHAALLRRAAESIDGPEPEE